MIRNLKSRLHTYYTDKRSNVHSSKLHLITDVYAQTTCFG